jgi:cell division protein FtsI (penicillin-binding protein 3)
MTKKQKPSSKKRLTIKGARSAALHQARARLVLVGGVFALAFILVTARVIDLSIIQGELIKNTIPSQVSNITEKPKEHKRRADIVDRNGVILATTLETPSLYVDPYFIDDAKEVAKDIVRVFPELTYGNVLEKLQRKARFVWIKRNLTPNEQYEVIKLGHPSLKFKEEYQRVYPHGSLFSHMVGYTNIDNKGLAGLERSFDQLLQEDSDNTLVSSFDVRVQHILHKEIKNAFEMFNAIGGAGVFLDAVNGEVLAAVSYPDFDPHKPAQSNKNNLFNRLTLGVYELGSVFKIFSTAAFLETQGVTMSKTFDAKEPIKRGGFKITDYHPEERDLTIPEVFMYSSNIGSALMGEAVGTKLLKSFYKDLGLLNMAELEIKELGKPLIPKPWRDINTLTASYGHGIAVSPLQLANAVGSIVNGGAIMNPTVIIDQDSKSETEKSPKLHILSPQTAHRMRQLLRLAVTDGTGTQADIKGYRVGGKTGTAEKSSENGYDKSRLISSFVAAFPMDAPRYVVFIMLDEPKGIKESFGYATGGWVSAPAAGNVIKAAAPLLGVLPIIENKDRDIASSLRKYVHLKEEVMR